MTLAFTVALLVTGGAVTAEMVSAQRATAVSIGDSGAAVGGPGAAAMDTALRDALATHPSVRVEGRVAHARYVVTASIVEWSNRPVMDGHEIRCGVSIVVTDNRGAVRAMLSGRAGARGDGDPNRLAERALLAATRSALRPLGVQLR